MFQTFIYPQWLPTLILLSRSIFARSVKILVAVANGDNSAELHYFGEHRPSYKIFDADNEIYNVDVIDTWNMTVKHTGAHSGVFKIDLPAREYMAVRLIKD